MKKLCNLSVSVDGCRVWLHRFNSRLRVRLIAVCPSDHEADKLAREIADKIRAKNKYWQRQRPPGGWPKPTKPYLRKRLNGVGNDKREHMHQKRRVGDG